MKSRMNIWNQPTVPNEESKKAEKKRENTTPSFSHGEKIARTKPEKQESGFEFEEIPPQKPQEDPNFDDIEADESDYPRMKARGAGRLLKRDQKRRHSLSVACSEVEADMLRDAAEKKGMTFSNWARRVLFRSAGLTIPKRFG